MAEETKPAKKEAASFWRSLFDDISIAQLLAGALAAVTSMLLASRIGIAGSVIGVAVGSIVSAVASQVYKKFLSASAEKIKDMAPDRGLFSPSHGVSSGGGHGGLFAQHGAHEGEMCGDADAAADDVREEGAVQGSAGDARAIAPQGASASETLPYAGVRAETSTLHAAGAGYTAAVAAHASDCARSVESKAYAESALARSRAARERKARVQRNAVVVAAISALVGIVASALIIEAVTAGQGVGSKPDPALMPSWSVSAHDAAAPKDEDASAGQASGDAGDKGRQDGSSDAAAPSTQDDAAAQEGQGGQGDSSEQMGSQPSEGTDSGDTDAGDASGQQGSGSQSQDSDSSQGSDAGEGDGSSNAQSPSGGQGSSGDSAAVGAGSSSSASTAASAALRAQSSASAGVS